MMCIENKAYISQTAQYEDDYKCCGIDKMDTISELSIATLESLLPVSDLVRECRYFGIHPLKIKYNNSPFITKICVVAPTPKFLELINDPCLKYRKISYIEIYEDTYCNSKDDAISMSYATMKIMTMKYTSEHKPYENIDRSGKLLEGHIGDKTGYYGGYKFKLVIYPRLSKINNTPCIHREFRIKKAGDIFKRTGIKHVSDLIAFDYKYFFEENEQRYIEYKVINDDKFGRLSLGLIRSKKLSDKELRQVQIMSQTYLNYHGITTPSEFKKHIKDEKKRIKSKRGPKTTYERYILKMRSNAYLVAL